MKRKGFGSALFLLVMGYYAGAQDTRSSDVIRENRSESGVTADYSDFNIIFHQDLEETPLGYYNWNQFQSDWNNPPWGSCYSRVLITDYNSGGRRSRGMKWVFPEGTFSSNRENGYQWWTPLGGSYEECYITYSIMFKPGFQAVKGGKIPGVQGGSGSSGDPKFEDGFGGSLMFKPGPKPVFYIYHHDMPLTVGETRYWNNYTFDVSTDIWYDITFRVVMNTATATSSTGPEGLKDGIVEGYVNGKLWGQWTGIRLRNLASIGVDIARIQAFFGGSNEDWSTIRDEWILIDNVYLWTYSNSYLANNPDVKRGRQINAIEDVIYTPIDALFRSGQQTGTDPVANDTEAPTVPTGLRAIDSTQNSVTLTWNAASDNVAVTGYQVFVNDIIYGSAGTNTYTVTQLEPSTQYSFGISSYDAAGNNSPKSSSIYAYTRSEDSSPPSTPRNLSVDRVTSASIEVSWEPSTDNVGVKHYEIFLDGIAKYTTSEVFFSFSRLEPSTAYRISLRAYDAAGNRSGMSDEVEAFTLEPDREPPTVPGGLRETEVTEKTISLTWNPSTDNVGVRLYKIYVNQVEWEYATRTNETITGLQPGIGYHITVSAVDEAGNESARSIPIEVETKNSDITTQPKLPEISIIQVQDKTINPQSITEMTSLGFAELTNFGLEILETEKIGKESLVITGRKKTHVVNVNRVSEGLKALYNFSEGEGEIVSDISGIEPAMDLRISREGLATEWLIGQGLRITDNTILSPLESPDKLVEALSASNEVTIEAWIKQEKINQSGPARIVTLSSSNTERAVTLAHEGNNAYYNYVARLNTTGSADPNGNPQLISDQDFISTSLHHVVYTRDDQGFEYIYINGLRLNSGLREGDFSSWDQDYQFALGNEIGGERPWKGIFYLVAVYNRSLTYEEVNRNYGSGFGQIRFTTDLDTLESNINYRLKPFINTNQGLVYGEAKDFIYKNVARTDSLFVFYPNPSNGQIYVTIRNRDESIDRVYLRLADFSGQIHFSREIDLSEGLIENQFELQIPSSLQNGLYSLILIAGNRSVAEKFVLMR